MKATTLALIAAVTGLAAATTTARAESRVSVHFGINTRPAYSYPEPAYSYPAPAYYPPAPVVVAPAPVYVEPRGHWEDVTTRAWVPARYVETRDAWGRCVNVLEPAHFAYTTNRVWVEEHHHHGGYDRDDRGYGYDRDRGYVRPGYGWGYGRR